VAHSNLRLAAGVGVTAAFFLVGAPATMAIADPGGSGHGNRSDDRDWGISAGGPNRGGGGDDRYSDNDNRGSDYNANPPTFNAPQTRVGSGRTDTDSTARAPETAGDFSTQAPAAADTPAGPPIGEASGPENVGAPTSRSSRPRVRFGNGRPPIVRHRTGEPPAIGAPEIAPPPPVEVTAPALPPANRFHMPRILPQLEVAPATDWTDPLFGLAGLLLIPAAGAALGYRQAKAAQASEVLTRP
jgi:hypothetical protein